MSAQRVSQPKTLIPDWSVRGSALPVSRLVPLLPCPVPTMPSPFDSVPCSKTFVVQSQLPYQQANSDSLLLQSRSPLDLTVIWISPLSRCSSAPMKVVLQQCSPRSCMNATPVDICALCKIPDGAISPISLSLKQLNAYVALLFCFCNSLRSLWWNHIRWYCCVRGLTDLYRWSFS